MPPSQWGGAYTITNVRNSLCTTLWLSLRRLSCGLNAAEANFGPGPIVKHADPSRRAVSSSTLAGERTIRVLIVDDHEVVRAGIRTLLQAERDIQIVAEAATGSQALIL